MKSFYIIIMISVFFACVDKMQLPDSLNDNTEFAAGDTTYLLIQPIWDESVGLQSPIEISIAQDGRVFVADTGANSIFVFSQNGDLLTGFNELQNLPMKPIDVDIDQKMNVYFTDGSQKIFVWNQYINDVGVEEIAVSGSFYNEDAGSMIIDAFSEEWAEFLNDADWDLESVTWGTPQTVIDSLLSPHIFYDGLNPIHSFNDIYYESGLSTFSGLSAATDESNYIYALDYIHDRIIRIDLQRTYLLKLSNGEETWTHQGVFKSSVSESGTGAGTVNNPLGIDVDYSGNIYYTQTGDFFSVHKIHPVTSGTYTTYPSVFQQGTNEIMDLFRFSNPADIAVDNNQFVYVSNTEAQEIQIFDSNGQFFLKAGVEKFTIDTTLHVFNGTDTVAVDTFVTIEEKGFLVEPQGITVDNRGIIYICDTPTGRILRYRLSNQLDEDLQPFQ
jgi:sugar lactone lactonase YvrE